MKCLVIIPSYNEEKNIVKVVTQIQSSVPEFDYVIINDGSSDKTLELCEENSFNIMNLPINLGIGGAMQTGYKYAAKNGYDYAIQFDGDGQHNCYDIARLYNKIVSENFNIVIGSRFIKKEGFQSTFARRIGIRYFSRLIWLLTKCTITDPTSGFRICDKKTIEFFAKNYPRDYPEPDSIVSALGNGFKISEIDTHMNERQAGASSINKIKSIYYMIKVTLAILISYKKNKNSL